MQRKSCPAHYRQLIRALTSRGLSEIGWRTEAERKQAMTEQTAGHLSRKSFNPFIAAMFEIFTLAGEKCGENADGCPVCSLQKTNLIEEIANKMAAISQNLPDE